MKKNFAPNRKPQTTKLVKENQEPIIIKKKVFRKIKLDTIYNENYKKDIASLKKQFEEHKKKLPVYFINCFKNLKNKNEVVYIMSDAHKYLTKNCTLAEIKQSRKVEKTILTTNIPARVIRK